MILSDVFVPFWISSVGITGISYTEFFFYLKMGIYTLYVGKSVVTK